MTWITAVVLSVIIGGVLSSKNLNFPSDFKFGAATSAYQVEGAWNVSDKTPNICDQFVHNNPSAIKDGSTGDVTCNSYEFWRRDVEMAAELSLNFYRFSIDWSRLLPKGFSNYIREDGKRYYSNLIDGLLEAGVEPVVTLYHWDLPQSLQDLGGWTNPEISAWFADYAQQVFKLFAGRVKIWITINEPIVMCDEAYNTGSIAPGIKETAIAPFLCIKNILLAHAKAWRIYDSYFKPIYHGKVSIANHLLWYEAKTKEDEELTQLFLEYTAGLYCHPIYSEEGGWPAMIEEVIKNVSLKKRYERSRLPKLTELEKKIVKDRNKLGKSSRAAFSDPPTLNLVKLHINANIFILHTILIVIKEAFSYTEDIHPTGLRKIYGDYEMFITENGYSTAGHVMNDQKRIDFIREHLTQVLLAMDGVNVTGYTYWALMDNFEWNSGYTTKYGLYDVNFNDTLRQRSPRKSAYYYANVIKTHSLD